MWGWWSVSSQALDPEMVSSPASLPLTSPPAHLSFTGSLKHCSEAQSDHFTSVSSPSLSPSFSGVKASCLSLVLRALCHPRLPFQLPFLPLSTSNSPATICLPVPKRHQGLHTSKPLHSRQPESVIPQKTPTHPSTPSSDDGIPPRDALAIVTHAGVRVLCLPTLCISGRTLTLS